MMPIEDASATVPAAEPEYVTLLDLVNTVLRYRHSIVLLALTLAVIAVLWSLGSARRYVASASFLPQPREASGSGASAIARQFGIVGLGAESGTFSPLFYAELIRSRRISRSVLTSAYMASRDNAEGSTLIDIWDIEDAAQSVMLSEAGSRLHESTSVSVSAETGVVELFVSTLDPQLSEQIAERFVQYLSEFNLETRRQQALQETDFASERLEQVTDSLRSAERAQMTFLERNRFFENSPALVFEHDRLQRQVIHQQAMYSSLMQSLETARTEAARDLPVLTIINQPAGSAVPEGRRTILKALVALIAGLLLGIILAFLREYVRHEAAVNRPAGRELRSLASEALNDLRNPLRVLGGRR